MPGRSKKNLLHLPISIPNKHNFFYYLDCSSGEGLINPLLTKLKNISSDEFTFYLKFILRKCINVNRSFSDAIDFFLIWLKKSPDTLLKNLKSKDLKQYFNRTEFGQDGDQWHFPRLLQAFLALIENESVTANEILDYLFETFDFFSIPDIFTREIIGYNRLEQCINESPAVFKRALLLKMYEFIEKNKTIDIGLDSYRYLIQAIKSIKGVKIESDKQTDRQELIFYMKNHFFIYRSVNNFNPSESVLFSRTTYY